MTFEAALLMVIIFELIAIFYRIKQRGDGMKVWFYKFYDSTVFMLYQEGFSAEEIWALEKIHGRLIESDIRRVTE